MRGVVSSAVLSESDIMVRLARDKTAESAGTGSPSQDDPAPWAPPRPAAVLVPLVRIPAGSGGPGWHILYTRRTHLVQHHKGQVSFPGGRSDPGDASPEATALREVHEEIGLHPSDVRLLGRMEDFMTISNFRVTPVVGTIPWPYPFTLNPQEVSRVFTVPADWLAASDRYGIHRRELPPDFLLPPHLQDQMEEVIFEPYEGEVIRGATARATLRLIERLLMTG